MEKSEGDLPRQGDERRSSSQLCKNQAHELDDAKVGSPIPKEARRLQILTQLQFFGTQQRRLLHDHRLNMCISRRDSTLVNANPSTPSNEPPSNGHSSLVDREPRRSEMRRPLHRRAKPRLPLLARRKL